MPNYRRNRTAGGTYFFTVVTPGRRRFLTEKLARKILRGAFREIRRRRPFSIDAIVLLPDHLHRIWTLPEGDAEYSVRWNQLKKRFTRAWLAAGGQEATTSSSRASRRERGVWQRRMFEHTCRDETDLKRCVDYLHANPLKHGLVERVQDWPWSTFFRFVKQGEYSLDWGNSSIWYGDEWRDFE